MRATILVFAVALTGTTAVFAQGSNVSVISGPAALKWGPAPPGLPKGAEVAVLAGDPAKEGRFAVRLKMPANYQIPAHHHSTPENVTVLSGSFHAGMGDKLDETKAEAFEPGGFAAMPANMNHYGWTVSETVVQIEANGPFDIIYVNPQDDPRKAR
jgi:hypothetical protein